MIFSLVVFYWCVMDTYSKREVLELFYMNEKNFIAWFIFINLPPICELFKIFRKKCVRNFDSAP